MIAKLARLSLLVSLVVVACARTPAPEAQTPLPETSITPSPAPPPERNIALNKPVRVSASWVVDPPERAVNGNPSDWWGAGGPVPQWIEVDLQGLYSISRIRVINQGPTGNASYQVLGRGADNKIQLLHVFEGYKSENQTLEFTPETPWEDIATIRIEINSGSGWVGLREIQVFSRRDPKPLSTAAEVTTPPYLAQVQPAALQPITADNAILMEQLAMLGRGRINQLTWSPDGKTLAAASPLGVWLYDPADLNPSPRLLEGHSRDVISVAFSPDGATVLSGSQDGTVKHWDATTGDLKRTTALWADFSYEVGEQKREPEVWGIAFSPDGRLLAAGSYDGALRLWDLSTGTLRSTLAGHTAPITYLVFSPDGTLLASSSVDGTILVWDVAANSQRASLPTTGQVQSVVFSPDGATLAYGGTGMTVHLLDTVTGKESKELAEQSGVISLAFSPDGQTLAASDITGKLLLWDVESGSSRVFKEHADWILKMAYAPDGETLATYAWDGSLRLWETATGSQSAAVSAHTSPVNSLAFSPDSSTLATGGDDNAVRVWEVGDNTLRAALWGHTASVTGVAFSPDGNLAASSSLDGTVRLWDPAFGRQVAVLSGHRSYVRCVAFSPDGKTIASGGTDRTVRLWDVATGEERATLTGHTGEVESVAFSPDGAWLVSASSDHSLRLWDVAAGREAGALQGHQSFALSAAFGPDGARLASGGGDHSLRLWKWEVAAGAPSGTSSGTSIGHGGWVLSVTFSPDGAIVASANVSTTSYWVAPGEIHLYSADSGYPYVMLRGHTKRITSIAFSPDGKLLASGSADGSVRLWGVQAEMAPPESPQAPVSPTATPIPLPTPSAWRDEFNGSLAEGWWWVRENSDKWSLSEKPGFLRIYASPYEINGKMSNQLFRSVAQGDFVITTHVFFEPRTNFQFAGLQIYQDEANTLSLGRAFCDTPNACVGNGIYFDYVAGGTWTGGNFGTVVENRDEAYLRLERQGQMVKASFSYEGITWFEIGTHWIPPDFRVNGIGLIAVGDFDKSDKDIPADFDFFELSEGQ